MKTRSIIFSLIAVLILVSCKSENEKKVEDKNNVELPETFDVSFNVTVLKDDTFHLLYTQDGTLNFSDDKKVALIIKGNDKPQDILFKLPKDVLPTNIRLDLGQNKDQGEMSINSIKVKYFKNTFEHKENIVKNYFYFNDFQLSRDDKSGKVKAVIGSDGRHVPLMWSNELLSDELKKIGQGK